MKLMSLLVMIITLVSCSQTPSRSIAQVDNQVQEVLSLHDQSEDRMPKSGQFQGQRVENTLGRTLSLLSPQEKALFSIDEDHLAFANFRHLGHFYIVTVEGMTVTPDQRIKKSYNVVEKVTFRKEHWSPLNPATNELEAHSLIKFTFSRNSGIRLVYDQTDKKYVSTSTPLIREAVASWEAIRSANNPKADWMKSAIKYEFAGGYLFYSAAERARMIAGEKRIFKEYPFNFSHSRSIVSGISSPMDALLFTSIKSSYQYGRNQTYNIVFNNCSARSFDLLDVSSRPTGPMQFGAIQKKAIEFANNDAKSMAKYLLDMAKTKKIPVPKDVETALVQLTSGVLLKGANDLNFSRMNNPKAFLYEAPPFVEAHLKVRGLIP